MTYHVRLGLPVLAGLAFLPGVASAQSDLPACGRLPSGVASYECTCPAGGSGASVWGSGPYTADSDICTAARHAGAIGADGGAVAVSVLPGEASYSGSEANGVKTSDWGSYSQSIAVKGLSEVAACGNFPQGESEITCSCPAGSGTGSVWGSGPYTSDSDLCGAARHAGVIGLDGGTITVFGFDGLASYKGSERNGIRTQDWAEYGESIIIDANAP